MLDGLWLQLPAKEVAKELGMCLTSLKKVCRQHGIVRWPYRRLKMIDRVKDQYHSVSIVPAFTLMYC